MRAAFAKARSKSSSKDKADQVQQHQPDEGVAAVMGDSETLGAGPLESSLVFRGVPQKHSSKHPIKVKVKSASVESHRTIPSVRCASLNSYDDDASTSEASSQTGGGSGSGGPCGSSSLYGAGGDKTRASSQESLKQVRPCGSSSSFSKCFLSISPLRPSLSTSCLFSGSVVDETSQDCDSSSSVGGVACIKSGRGGKQQSSSALICIPTRASLTHEWRRLKTPNKCRECNLLVYFNGRECSMCGFVAHKKCITVMVIKCLRTLHTNNNHTTTTTTLPDHNRHKQHHYQQQQQQPQPNLANAAAQTMGGIGAAFFGLRNHHQNIRSFGNLASYGPYGSANASSQMPHNPIFGQSIVGIDSEQVLDFVNRFVYEIDTRGLTSKGIYRVSSIKSKVDKLCNYYDQNPSSLIDLSSFHPNIIANALKMYLRKLPEPLLTNELYDSFIRIARRYNNTGKIQGTTTSSSTSNESQQQQHQTEQHPSSTSEPGSTTHNPDELLAEFKEVVEQLPVINKQLAAIIMRHLRRVAEMAEENQMSAKNLSIIFGPTLLSAGEHKSSVAIVDNIHQARLVELMIDWAYQIFPHTSRRSSRELASSRDQSNLV
uniref:Rho GTPase-activating protein 29 n=1 Tax=Aceria tosichella TaxID=561515 RepID=A0A6G1SJX9_9ACAR